MNKSHLSREELDNLNDEEGRALLWGLGGIVGLVLTLGGANGINLASERNTRFQEWKDGVHNQLIPQGANILTMERVYNDVNMLLEQDGKKIRFVCDMGDKEKFPSCHFPKESI